MVEITSEEQNKVKIMKRTEDSFRTSGTISNGPTLGGQKPKGRKN